LGSKHPDFDMQYEVNYGYIPGTIGGDGEEIDVYVLGAQKPLQKTKGLCIGVVLRLNDNEYKLLVSVSDKCYTKEEVARQIEFQEKWFQSKIILLKT